MTEILTPHGLVGITLTEPWATLVAAGYKTIETRSWRPHHPMPFAVAIHAGSNLPKPARDLILKPGPVQDALIANGINPLTGDAGNFDWKEHGERLLDGANAKAIFDGTRGRVLAYALVTDIVQFPLGEDPAAKYGSIEVALGDFHPGRYGYVLTAVERVEKPYSYTGHQMIWPIPALNIPSARSYLARHGDQIARSAS